MSIYTKIFATASIFAIAASALISPSVNAAVVNNTTLPAGHILCALKAGNNTSSAIALSSVVGTYQGELYTVHLVNSSSCGLITGTPGTNGNASAGISTYVFDTHATQLNIATLTAGTSTAAPVLTGTATYENNIPKYTGATTINVCLGVSKEYEIKFEDTVDNDYLEEATVQTALGSNAFVRSTSANGSLTYFIKPTTQAFSTLNNSFTFTPSVREQANSNRTTANIANNYGTTVVTPVVTFKTVEAANCPTTTTVSSSSVSSSSVTASSTAAVSSTAASATAAVSSTTTVVVDAPSAGKGSATVRTGGAY
jgi:hypothetical protein